jgi:hypothetical protein
MQLLFSICLIVFPADAGADCARPALAHQRRDAATIQRLESAWSLAYLTGDAEFEACLLTPDFAEIMSNGSINHLREELELAEKNKGKAATAPNMPPITIPIHGDVAVAYGISSEKLIDGKPHRSYFADYYLWKTGYGACICTADVLPGWKLFERGRFFQRLGCRKNYASGLENSGINHPFSAIFQRPARLGSLLGRDDFIVRSFRVVALEIFLPFLRDHGSLIIWPRGGAN